MSAFPVSRGWRAFHSLIGSLTIPRNEQQRKIGSTGLTALLSTLLFDLRHKVHQHIGKIGGRGGVKLVQLRTRGGPALPEIRQAACRRSWRGGLSFFGRRNRRKRNLKLLRTDLQPFARMRERGNQAPIAFGIGKMRQ